MAYQFDGSSQYLYYSPPVTAAPFTMSIWFNSDDYGENCVIWLGDKDSANDEWRIRFNNGTTINMQTQDGVAAVNQNTSNVYTAGTYSHAAFIETSSSSRRIVLDGDWANSDTSSTAVSPADTDRLVIGARWNGSASQFADGGIGEVAIWDAALAQADVEALAEGLSPLHVKPASLAFYAPLVRGTQDIIGGLTATTS